MDKLSESHNTTTLDTVEEYEGKKLIPNTYGTCDENSIKINFTSSFNLLFPFLPDRQLHVFCINIDGVESSKIPENEIYKKIVTVLKQEMLKTGKKTVTISNSNFDNKITICSDMNSFANNLVFDMTLKKCLPIERMNELQSFLISPSDTDAHDNYWECNDSDDVVLIYIISNDVYDFLRKSYKLPKLGSSVIKIIPNVIISKISLDYLCEAEKKFKELLVLINEVIIAKDVDVDKIPIKVLSIIRPNDLFRNYKQDESRIFFKDDDR